MANPILSNTGVTGSFLLRINGKYKKSSETNAQFSYDLVSSQACASVTSISLLQFTMNRVFGNIYSGSNVLVIDNDSGPTVIITVPEGQYNITQLVNTLNILATTAYGPGELEFTWDTVLDRVAITSFNSDGETYTIVWDLSTLAPYIGISTNFAIPYNQTVLCPSPPQLQGPDQIFVESQILASGQCLDDPQATGGSIPLLGVIPCGDVPYGYTINYTVQELDQTVVTTNHGQPGQLKRIDISLTDKYGYLLNVPETCYADILFRVTYMPN
jgi:hypothetical protein